MKKVLLLTILLASALPADAAIIKAIMEGRPATNDTIMVDTTTVRVGISTGIPQATLHVAGDVLSDGSYYGDGSHLDGIGDSISLASTNTWTAEQFFVSTSGITVPYRVTTDELHVDEIYASSMSLTGTLYAGREDIEVTCSNAITCAASCTPPKTLMSGGCDTNPATNIVTNKPESTIDWRCKTTALTEIKAYAICVRID